MRRAGARSRARLPRDITKTSDKPTHPNPTTWHSRRTRRPNNPTGAKVRIRASARGARAALPLSTIEQRARAGMVRERGDAIRTVARAPAACCGALALVRRANQPRAALWRAHPLEARARSVTTGCDRAGFETRGRTASLRPGVAGFSTQPRSLSLQACYGRVCSAALFWPSAAFIFFFCGNFEAEQRMTEFSH